MAASNTKTTLNNNNNNTKLSQWQKIKMVCKVVRGKLQKAHTMGYLTVPGMQSTRSLSRLSSSCPSLNVDGEAEGSDTPLSTAWSEELLLDAPKGCGMSTLIMADTQRRRSWSGISDTEKNRARQRSVSLSSLESDGEEPFYDAADDRRDGVDGRRHSSHHQHITNDKIRSLSGSSSPGATTACCCCCCCATTATTNTTTTNNIVDSHHHGGRHHHHCHHHHHHPRGSSTHSLNDVGGVVVGGGGVGGGVSHVGGSGGGSGVRSSSSGHRQSSNDKPRLLTPRLTLQKSISTPSILANIASAHHQTSYPDEEDQTTSSSKRRKRGSIFSRKKKEKPRKSCHQFVPVCFSTNATCDVCTKPMMNKPALRCESCLVCVHEHSCKDHISDCSKLKNPKVVQKPGTPLSVATKSSSLGSHPSSTSSLILAHQFPGGPMMGRAGPRSSSIGHTGGHHSSPTRPHSLGTSASPVRRLSGLSQWKRVATKLGVNTKTITTTEEKDPELLHDLDNNMLEINSASMESLDDNTEDSPNSMDDIDGDPELRLLEKEPELWVHTVEKSVVECLSEKQVKKQEHIYELIITEKHHCRMLKVMQKVFAVGMSRELGMPQSRIRRVFPCLEELLTLHCSFLWRLRQRQRECKVIDSIGDLILEQFIGDNAQGLKDAYGLFCSQHQEAVVFFKELCKTDRRFNAFIQQRVSHPLMNKRGVPECILSVTNRVTKYPLITEALIKYSQDQEEETAQLKQSLENIKEILVNINTQVAEKEKRQRLLEIYHKIDAKSSITYRDLKFKKSDLLNNSRSLKFEGNAILKQDKGKPLPVHVVVMSDLAFFVHENNQKYYFVSPDNKAGAIPLDKLLMRERAGGVDSRSIFFIHEKKTQAAELFELECQHPKDKKIWFESIREAVQQCPEELDTNDGAGVTANSLQHANAEKLRHLLGILHHKDRDIARLCEEKETCLADIMQEVGLVEPINPYPNYRLFLEEHNMDPAQARELQIKAINDALKLVSGACGWGSGLARSVSSVGEHQSDAYVSPSLPKRAETFGGFDNSNKDGSAAHGTAQQQPKQPPCSGKKKKESKLSLAESSADQDCPNKVRRASASLLTPRASQDNLSIMSSISSEISTVVGSAQDLAQQQQQQEVAAKLMSCLHVALVLSQHHITQYELMLRGVGSGGVGSNNTEAARFRHSQKLEELRNIQEQISHDRHNWNKERECQEKWLQEKRAELRAQQEQVRAEQADIEQQRELLYRKLEALKCQGIILSPTLTVHNTSTSALQQQNQQEDSAGDASSHSSPGATNRGPLQKSSRSTPPIIKRDSSSALPTHLISGPVKSTATAAPVVRQQLPMKLAKLGSGSSSSGSSASSSLTSSISLGGGSMSPQEQRTGSRDQQLSREPSRGSLIGSSSVTQILPLKLSERASSSSDGSKGSLDSRIVRKSQGYQRLHSPPTVAPPTAVSPGLSSSASITDTSMHHRTGSSPATLQNGGSAGVGPSSSQPNMASITNSSQHAGINSPNTIGGSTIANQKATRTNTYPKLPTKPTLPSSSSRVSSPQQQQTTAPPPNVNNARPGQRIKDPDTNEDIMFF